MPWPRHQRRRPGKQRGRGLRSLDRWRAIRADVVERIHGNPGKPVHALHNTFERARLLSAGKRAPRDALTTNLGGREHPPLARSEASEATLCGCRHTLIKRASATKSATGPDH
jgi:hypothetical protein